MLFDGKVKRLLDPEKSEKEFEEEMKGQELEKKDPLAMILAALIVFVPALLLVMGIFALAIWLVFGRFL